MRRASSSSIANTRSETRETSSELREEIVTSGRSTRLGTTCSRHVEPGEQSGCQSCGRGTLCCGLWDRLLLNSFDSRETELSPDEVDGLLHVLGAHLASIVMALDDGLFNVIFMGIEERVEVALVDDLSALCLREDKV